MIQFQLAGLLGHQLNFFPQGQGLGRRQEACGWRPFWGRNLRLSDRVEGCTRPGDGLSWDWQAASGRRTERGLLQSKMCVRVCVCVCVCTRTCSIGVKMPQCVLVCAQACKDPSECVCVCVSVHRQIRAWTHNAGHVLSSLVPKRPQGPCVCSGPLPRTPTSLLS